MKGNVTTASGSSTTNGTLSTIHAKNTSGAEITKGDKVLVTIGSRAPEKEFSKTSSTVYNHAPLWYDNGTVQFGGGTQTSQSFVLNYDNETWNVTGAINIFGDGFFHYEHGVLSLSKNIEEKTTSTDTIYTSYGKQTLNTYCIYLGKYNGIDYVYDRSDKIKTYDLETNTPIATVYEGDNASYSAFRDDNIICIADTTSVRFLEISADDTINLITQKTVSSFRALYATGLKTGDYILTTNYSWNDSTALGKNTTPSPLIIYQIGENYSLNKITIPCLEKFEHTTSIINYDTRTNLLCIGTKNGIYLYKLTNNTWKEIPLNIDTSEMTPKYCLRGATSPDGTRLAVQYIDKNTGLNSIVYSLGTTENHIVTNSSGYYSANNSFTGFATGNKTDDNSYEVETILPDQLTLTVNIIPEPETFEIHGGI